MGQCIANSFSNLGANISYSMGQYPLCEFIVGPTDSPVITEIDVYVNASAVLSTAVCLGIASSPGVNPQYVGPPMQSYDPNNSVGGLTLATRWSVPPGNPLKWLRRHSITYNTFSPLPPIVFKFPRGLSLAPSSSLILLNTVGSNGRCYLNDVWVEYDN